MIAFFSLCVGARSRSGNQSRSYQSAGGWLQPTDWLSTTGWRICSGSVRGRFIVASESLSVRGERSYSRCSSSVLEG